MLIQYLFDILIMEGNVNLIYYHLLIDFNCFFLIYKMRTSRFELKTIKIIV